MFAIVGKPLEQNKTPILHHQKFATPNQARDFEMNTSHQSQILGQLIKASDDVDGQVHTDRFHPQFSIGTPTHQAHCRFFVKDFSRIVADSLAGPFLRHGAPCCRHPGSFQDNPRAIDIADSQQPLVALGRQGQPPRSADVTATAGKRLITVNFSYGLIPHIRSVALACDDFPGATLCIEHSKLQHQRHHRILHFAPIGCDQESASRIAQFPKHTHGHGTRIAARQVLAGRVVVVIQPNDVSARPEHDDRRIYPTHDTDTVGRDLDRAECSGQLTRAGTSPSHDAFESSIRRND